MTKYITKQCNTNKIIVTILFVSQANTEAWGVSAIYIS